MVKYLINQLERSFSALARLQRDTALSVTESARPPPHEFGGHEACRRVRWCRSDHAYEKRANRIDRTRRRSDGGAGRGGLQASLQMGTGCALGMTLSHDYPVVPV